MKAFEMFTTTKRKVLLAAGLMMLPLMTANADEALTITAMPDYEIEVRVDGEYRYLPGKQIATPPVRVLEVDDMNYLKIRADDGRIVWVNRAEVTTSDLAKSRKTCQDIALAGDEDSIVLGVRSLGDNCER